MLERGLLDYLRQSSKEAPRSGGSWVLYQRPVKSEACKSTTRGVAARLFILSWTSCDLRPASAANGWDVEMSEILSGCRHA